MGPPHGISLAGPAAAENEIIFIVIYDTPFPPPIRSGSLLIAEPLVHPADPREPPPTAG